jgi:hypothetical protein
VNFTDMDTPHVYEIRVEGHLTDRWSDWFSGLTIRNEPNSQTTLTGRLSDQAALFGVLTRIHNLNLILISVLRLPNEGAADSDSYI